MRGNHPFVLISGISIGVLLFISFLAVNATGHFEDNPVNYLPVVYKMWPPPTPTPSPGRLLITEVLFNPDGAEPDEEWVEVYNVGDLELDLSNYKIGDEEIKGGSEGMYRFPPDTSLTGKGILVIANHALVFANKYGVNPDFEYNQTDPGVPSMVKYALWSGGTMFLNNDGDEVLVLNDNDELADAVSWGSSNFAFIPAVPKAADGVSIERYPADVDSDNANDWRNQSNPAPGVVDYALPTATPDETPSPAGPMVLNEINVDPDPVHGDANGDGVVDTGDDEFVEIVNTSGSALDISGWTINDQTGLRHTFPAGTIISDGCAVVVFGGGEPMGSFGGGLVQTSSNGMLGLNNDGDTLTLYDLSDEIVLSYTYGSEGADNQSLTRDPDINGPEPLIKHSTATGAGGALYSPGTRTDGSQFSGCPGV